MSKKDNASSAPFRAASTSCPACGEHNTWRRDNDNRPFCSARCKDADFIGWADETNRIEGSGVYDDILSDTLDRQ